MPAPPPGLKSYIEVGDGTAPTEVFAKIARQSDVSLPFIEWQMKQTDPYGQEVGEQEKTMYRIPDLSISIEYNPSESTHSRLMSILAGRAPGNFKAVHYKSDGSGGFLYVKIPFTAHIKSMPIKPGKQDFQMLTVNLAPTGGFGTPEVEEPEEP